MMARPQPLGRLNRPCLRSDVRIHVGHLWPVNEFGHAVVGDPESGDEAYIDDPYVCYNCHETFEQWLSCSAHLSPQRSPKVPPPHPRKRTPARYCRHR